MVHDLSDTKEQLVLSKEEKEQLNLQIETLSADLKVCYFNFDFNPIKI